MPDLSQPGWRRQPDDPNDWIYQPPANQTVPAKKDLRDTHHMQREVYQQGNLGSCTANAIASALQYGKNAEAWGARNVPFNPSRLHIYFQERVIKAARGDIVLPDELDKYLNGVKTIKAKSGNEITRDRLDKYLKEDTGASVRYGIKGIHKNGFCWETGKQPSVWAYMDKVNDPSYYTPPDGALTEGRNFLNSSQNSFEYYRIKDLGEGAGANLIAHMEAAIAEGFPIIFGFEGSEDPDQGGTATWGDMNSDGINMKGDVWEGWPRDGDKKYWGHCVLAVGYDRKAQNFLILNSWGTGFGDGGYYRMPYKWFAESTGFFRRTAGDENSKSTRADDFWVVKSNISPTQPGMLGSN